MPWSRVAAEMIRFARNFKIRKEGSFQDPESLEYFPIIPVFEARQVDAKSFLEKQPRRSHRPDVFRRISTGCSSAGF